MIFVNITLAIALILLTIKHFTAITYFEKIITLNLITSTLALAILNNAKFDIYIFIFITLFNFALNFLLIKHKK